MRSEFPRRKKFFSDCSTLFLVVDIAAFHSVVQRFRRQVDHYGFIGELQYPIRHCFAHHDARDRVYR